MGSKKAHIWVLWHKAPNPYSWLKTVTEQLEIRQLAGQLKFETHRLCDVVMAIQDGKPELYIDGHPVVKERLPQVAYLYIPSINNSFSSRLHPVVLHLETLGVRCINSSQGFENTSNKFRQMCLLADHDVPMPDTVTTSCSVKDSIPSILEVPDLVQFPAILKHVAGMQGKRVMLIQNEEVARDICENLHDDHMYVMQEYVSDSHGCHIRAYVVGDNVLGFYRYVNKTTKRVQSNRRLGGERKPITRSEKCKQLALKVARILELDVTALDFLEDKSGKLYFIEANSSPGVFCLDIGTDVFINYLLLCCENHDMDVNDRGLKYF